MRLQTAHHVLMVKPANFGFNPQTQESNAFQKNHLKLSEKQIQSKAIHEFETLVEGLRTAGVGVTVVKDSVFPVKTDAIFPNNWVSFHQEGLIITYPMFAPSRRHERRKAVVKEVLMAGFSAHTNLSLGFNEKIEQYLEGTGSMVFDHVHRIAYACHSERTHATLFKEVCNRLRYHPLIFHAVDANKKPIYHTNVLMCIGDPFVVVALDTVQDSQERNTLLRHFADTKKEIVEISLDQMASFAGNMLPLRNAKRQDLLVMSKTAFDSLSQTQYNQLSQYAQLMPFSIPTIEHYGGGSVRCMMAEVFLPKVNP